MAWVRCCGAGEPPAQFPFDLTAQAWSQNIIGYVSVGGGQSLSINMTGTTPKINNNILSVHTGPTNSDLKIYYQVSTDNINWVTVISNTNASNTTLTANLSAYNGQKLYLKIVMHNVWSSPLTGQPVNANDPVFIIT